MNNLKTIRKGTLLTKVLFVDGLNNDLIDTIASTNLLNFVGEGLKVA